jgi:hypothetical protein
MSTTTRLLLGFGMTMLLASCAGPETVRAPANTAFLGSPAAPTGFPAPTARPPMFQTVVGIVRAGGAPVADARVTVQRPDASGARLAGGATTDGNGYFSIPAVNVEPTGRFDEPPLVGVSRPGFFTEFQYACADRGGYCDARNLDGPLEFNLVPWTEIPLDEEVEGRTGDARCAHWGYGWTSCQRLAITAPSTGTLVIAISVPAGAQVDYDIVNPDSTFAVYAPHSGGSVTPPVELPVFAGGTYEIRLAGFRAPGIPFRVWARMQCQRGDQPRGPSQSQRHAVIGGPASQFARIPDRPVR